MTEAKAFRAKRAADNVLRLAREWSKAETAWSLFEGPDSEEDKLHETSRLLHKRLEAACHELVAVEAET